MASAPQTLQAFSRALAEMVKSSVAREARSGSDLLLEAANLHCAISRATLLAIRKSNRAVAVDMPAPHAQNKPVSALLERINPNTLPATILDRRKRPFAGQGGSIGLNSDCLEQALNIGRPRHE
jgi:hypothetical protein